MAKSEDLKQLRKLVENIKLDLEVVLDMIGDLENDEDEM